MTEKCGVCGSTAVGVDSCLTCGAERYEDVDGRVFWQPVGTVVEAVEDDEGKPAQEKDEYEGDKDMPAGAEGDSDGDGGSSKNESEDDEGDGDGDGGGGDDNPPLLFLDAIGQPVHEGEFVRFLEKDRGAMKEKYEREPLVAIEEPDGMPDWCGVTSPYLIGGGGNTKAGSQRVWVVRKPIKGEVQTCDAVEKIVMPELLATDRNGLDILEGSKVRFVKEHRAIEEIGHELTAHITCDTGFPCFAGKGIYGPDAEPPALPSGHAREGKGVWTFLKGAELQWVEVIPEEEKNENEVEIPPEEWIPDEDEDPFPDGESLLVSGFKNKIKAVRWLRIVTQMRDGKRYQLKQAKGIMDQIDGGKVGRVTEIPPHQIGIAQELAKFMGVTLTKDKDED